LLELFRLGRQTLQGEQVGHRIGGMAAVADLIEPAPLSRPEARRSAGYHSLFHAGPAAQQGLMG
jgi:hypothetical protein